MHRRDFLAGAAALCGAGLVSPARAIPCRQLPCCRSR
ncbi:twin-arginine translocation signal domain-containing protein [Ensifer sp. IC3342]|nr:twin-arginine translocation signal domain-containing protein [Ensifer sp. BRP08]MCA1448326.1 twin-arginine translocation signal domain-containing protein [Ensifer sp. IC3342]